eukprot:CAMPEP_0169274042 /NCGR_PEP_ID=MMETSP1016-20121227/51484_1 /TAXON_ID=342587 /ORGANISM="Karlodinium micrum, Strain CCMP2283" /LENGTH=57 /DNA_ID=CAMNT_0009360517 /DNA_START=191 /DNA_END=360 /DNA_ORIENTATION=-
MSVLEAEAEVSTLTWLEPKFAPCLVVESNLDSTIFAEIALSNSNWSMTPSWFVSNFS